MRDHSGIKTASITWIVPLVHGISVFVTRAVPIVTPSSVTRIGICFWMSVPIFFIFVVSNIGGCLTPDQLVQTLQESEKAAAAR